MEYVIIFIIVIFILYVLRMYLNYLEFKNMEPIHKIVKYKELNVEYDNLVCIDYYYNTIEKKLYHHEFDMFNLVHEWTPVNLKVQNKVMKNIKLVTFENKKVYVLQDN
jgi:hypothetical protein